MGVEEFAERFERALRKSATPRDFASEQIFEIDFVIPTARAVGSEAGVRLFAHPFKSKDRCKHCDEPEGSVLGCPRCWKASKLWATTSAFGMRHTFDLVARDADGKTLAVEIKYIRFRGRRAPNGEFQRFLGQCALAATVHDIVVGVCGLDGRVADRYDEHRAHLVERFERLGVRLVVLDA
jgi:hypothetical protein